MARTLRYNSARMLLGVPLLRKLARNLMYISVSALTSVACAPRLGQRSADLNAMDQANPTIVQIVPTQTLAAYKAAMPKFAFQRLNSIVTSSDTLWYDKTTMIGTYQDTVGHGQGAPIGMRRNGEGAGLIVPQGRKLFSADGKTWSFPFAHTAGTDRSSNLQVVNFMHLPRAEGTLQPVVYWIINDRRTRGGLGLLQWRWMYPRGTVFGEMLFNKTSDGQLLPTELRTRERQLVGWSTNVYRPFSNAAALSIAIKQRRPNWQQLDNLNRVIQSLESDASLKPLRMNSDGFPGTFRAEGFQDELPDFGDEELVKELLRNTPFVSVYGEAWKESGERRAFAPTSTARLSIVPNQYEAGILEMRDNSCQRCHQDAQRRVEDFAPAAILYGDIWGSDDIFSFHPFDQRRYSADGNENRSVRPEFASSGMVQPYDPKRHTDSHYRNLRQVK